MTLLILAAVAFVGTHLLLSHPWRAPLVRRLGEKRFAGLYSLIALVSLAAMVTARRAVGPQAPLYDCGLAGWWTATGLMLLASVLFVGSFRGNPAMAGAAPAAMPTPRGVFAITRHPMMWAFALWALAHATVHPTPAGLVIDAAIATLALVGAAGQDRKKARQLGARWAQWAAQTRFFPFSRGLVAPGRGAALGGTLLWLAATWAHGALGHQPAGIWLFFR